MKRFRSIVVVVSGKDHGQAAIEQAANLAIKNSAKITLVDAISQFSSVFDPAGAMAAEVQHDLVRKQKKESMEQLARPLRDAGISVACQMFEGDLAEKTIECVISQHHDLLLKSAEHPQGIAQRVFGTVGQRLMRKCPCPVWIIRVDERPTSNRILVAIRPLATDQKRHPMNVAMMDMASELSIQFDCELHVVYVWPEPLDETRSEHQEIEKLQTDSLEQLIGPYRAQVPIHTHFLQGNPGNMIAHLAQKLEVDLLVMGTVCRSNFVFFTIGHTAERLLDEVQCSVLAIKPEKFQAQVFKGEEARSRLFGPEWKFA